MRKQRAVLSAAIAMGAMIFAALVTSPIAARFKGPSFMMVRGPGLSAPVTLGRIPSAGYTYAADTLAVLIHSSEPVLAPVDTARKLADYSVAEFFGREWAQADGTLSNTVRFEQGNQFSHFIVLANSDIVWDRATAQQRYFLISAEAKAYLQRHGIATQSGSAR